MKLTRPSDIRNTLAELGRRPDKSAGQHFLCDANILRILLDTAELSAEDAVVEIGPGLGVLTEELLGRVRRVLAIEMDPVLCDYLGTRLASPKLQLLCADALGLDWPALFKKGFNKVVANLPYSVGSRILVDILRCEPGPETVVVTVQLEVARRLAAETGTGDRGLLSVWAQLCYSVSVKKKIAHSCFYPPPRVQSAIVRMARLPEQAAHPAEAERLTPLLKYAFSQRRKQLVNLLSAPGAPTPRARNATAEILRKTGLSATARPEDLTVTNWCELAARLADTAS